VVEIVTVHPEVKFINNQDFICILFSLKGSYGNNRAGGNSNGRDRHGGNSLLDDLDSFTVGPLRPGPPVIKNFYSESPLVSNRPQVELILLIIF
jgi:hypothetical protein